MTVTIPATDTPLANMRLAVADNVAGRGPMPDGDNIQDETLLALLAEEGNVIGRGAARVFEYLAQRWAAMPHETRLDREWEKFDAVKHYRAEAARLRRLHGYKPETRSGRPSGAASLEIVV